jgi:hypothetical protein
MKRNLRFSCGYLLALVALTCGVSSCGGTPERPDSPEPPSGAPPNTTNASKRPAANLPEGETSDHKTPPTPAGPRIGVAIFASSFRDPDGPPRYSYAWTGHVVRILDPSQLNVTPFPLEASVQDLKAPTLRGLTSATKHELDFLVAGIVEIQGTTIARIVAYDIARQSLTTPREAEERWPTAAVEIACEAQLEELAQYWSDLDRGKNRRLLVTVGGLHSPQEVNVLLELLGAIHGVEAARHVSSTVGENDSTESLFHLFVGRPPRTLEVVRWESSLGQARLQRVEGWEYTAVYGDSN